MTNQLLKSFVKPGAAIDWSGPIPVHAIQRWTTGMRANAEYYDNFLWADGYFRHCHRYDAFKARWTAVAGSLDDRVVVDIGCGPGNILAALGGKPRIMIGVDVSRGSLEMARNIGYAPLLADAHDLPLRSGFADLVIANATLHHCDDMAQVLAEAARLVAPGGLLVTDHDPQLSAWDFKGPGRWLWNARTTIYAWFNVGFHGDREMQAAALATEVHHNPGEGVSRDLFESVLLPLGFDVELYPHNNVVGEEVLQHRRGRSRFRQRLGQRLSNLDPDTADAAISLMCRARRTSSAVSHPDSVAGSPPAFQDVAE